MKEQSLRYYQEQLKNITPYIDFLKSKVVKEVVVFEQTKPHLDDYIIRRRGKK